jgi:hypothetical protein
MKEYVLNEKDIEYLKEALEIPKTYVYNKDNYPNSIMLYDKVCNCDDGFLCEHRLEWLINFIESKKLKTRKTKLIKLNED